MAVEGFLVFILAGLSHIRNIDNRPAPVNRMKLFLCLQSKHNFVLKVIFFSDFFVSIQIVDLDGDLHGAQTPFQLVTITIVAAGGRGL